MNPEILAAVTAAVAMYIKEEECAQPIVKNETNFWRFSGRLAQMNPRIIASQAIPRLAKDIQNYYGLERRVTAKKRRNLHREFYA